MLERHGKHQEIQKRKSKKQRLKMKMNFSSFFRSYHRLKFIGNLKSPLPIPRQASGKVYVRKNNPSVIIISKFRYSGIGNNTFFWAGKGDGPSEQTIPGYPLGDGYKGKGI